MKQLLNATPNRATKAARTGAVPAAVAAALMAAAPAVAETTTFYFTDPGTTYTGFIFPGDPRIGGVVTAARIYLYVEVLPGSDAALFDTDLSLPIATGEGGTPIIAYTGLDLGWSGSGIFSFEEATTRHNGVILQTLYGAASLPLDAVLLDGSRIELDYTPVPAPAPVLALAAAGLLSRRRRR